MTLCMDLLNGCTSSPIAHSEPTLERRPMPEEDICSDVSAATQRESSPGGYTSPALTISKRDGLDMTDTDQEACEPSSHRHPDLVVGPPDVMDYVQDTPDEILAPWFQLTPDEAFEQCFQMDDLDSPLERGSCLVDFQIQPQFECTSGSRNSENSDTISPSVSMEIRDDQTVVTTSSNSMGISTNRSSGKRTCRPERSKIVEAQGSHCEGVEPGTQHKHSMSGGGQGRHLRKRLSSSDGSTRYAIKTTTDADVIDDGYRWRKYGQKPVKNSDHPRSYYRCTTLNCPVRKQMERCTENPHNVLTTYDGKHNHPKSSSPSMRESIPEEHVQDLPSAPIRPHDGYLGPPARLPPSNYLSQTLLDHMFSQGNINLLRAQQLFMLQQCQRQYPFFSGMLNLMQNYPLAQSPILDPRLALLFAQNYGMRLRAQANSDRSAAIAAAQQQALRSAAPLSRAQHRLLWMQELMGENRYSSGGDYVHQSQQQSEPSNPRGLGNPDG